VSDRCDLPSLPLLHPTLQLRTPEGRILASRTLVSRTLLGLTLLGLTLFAPGCAKEKQAKAAGGGVKSKTAFPVDVQPVASRRVEAAITAVGSVDAFEIVQVTARVPGAIEKMHFKEGDQVREGDVLVEIEPERYRLATEEARAALEKAEAALAEAEAGLARREGANERTTGLIPGEEIGTWRTRVRSEKAEVAARRAAVARECERLRRLDRQLAALEAELRSCDVANTPRLMLDCPAAGLGAA